MINFTPLMNTVAQMTQQKKQAQQPAPETTNVNADTGFNWGNMASGVGGALAGLGDQILNRNAGDVTETRRQEAEAAKGLKMQEANYANNQAIRPGETQQGQLMALNAGKAQAIQAAAAAGTGSALNSGLGGEVNSALISGIKAAAPVMQASAGYDTQIAQTYADRQNAEMQKVGQAQNIASQYTQLGDQTAQYVEGQPKKENKFLTKLGSGFNLGMTLYNQARNG